MAFNPAIPQPTDQLNQSQADLLGNFTALNTWMQIDHWGPNAAVTLPGKHTQVTLRTLAVSPTTLNHEKAIYAKLDSLNNPALLIRDQNNGTETNFTTATLADPGSCRLPCGLIMKWGSGTVGANSASAAMNFAVLTESTITTILSATASITGSAGMDKGLFIQTITPTSITVYNANANGGNRTFYYFVLGI